MKYLEELNYGDAFLLVNNPVEEVFFLTSDYKKSGEKLCYSLKNGSSRWFESNLLVDLLPLYSLDKENNVVAVKPTPRADS
jgi:hypothetical protein